MKKFLVLGSHSFSGSTFVNFLLDKKYDVIGTFNSKKSDKNLLFLKNKNLKKFKNFKINFLIKKDLNKLKVIIKKYRPNYIVDFASICDVNSSWFRPKDYIDINVSSKLDLLSLLSHHNFVKKYVYISTPEVFGSSKNYIYENCDLFNPSTPYATSKLAAENLIKNYTRFKNLPGIITRFSNFYGPVQLENRLIPKLILAIKLKKKFPLHGNGSSLRSFIFSEDYCEGIYSVIKHGKVGEVYHFSDYKFYKIIDIVKKVYKNFNLDYKKKIKFEKERIGKDQMYKLQCDYTKKKLKWSPKVNLNKGIIKVVDYDNKSFENNLLK